MAPPPKKRKSPAAAPTTICALGDDLLREVFLRLPSLPTLVRAALTSHSFLRAVRSSPTFRRRFRELHAPPLLGLFLGIFESDNFAFRPLRLRSDLDLAAVIRGADFFLTRLPDHDDEGTTPEWSIRHCHDGFVLLTSKNTDHLAVYNPLTRALELFPKPPAEICEGMCVEFFVISSEEDHKGTFRVICVCHQANGAQALVLSSETRKWQIFPWVDAASDSTPPGWYSDEIRGNLVNGFIYFTQLGDATARVLNTATFHFSRIDMPPRQEEFTFGQTMDGKLCVACTAGHSLVVCYWGSDDDGSERWMPEKTFPLEQAIYELLQYSMAHVALHIVGIERGFVYLSAYTEMDLKSSGWFLSFCLETAKLSKLCSILHTENMHPYVMAWPSSLVLNKPSTTS